MFYIKYLTAYKVHTHAGVIRKLLNGCAYVREIIHLLKLVDYLPVHAHKPCINLHFFTYARMSLIPLACEDGQFYAPKSAMDNDNDDNDDNGIGSYFDIMISCDGLAMFERCILVRSSYG